MNLDKILQVILRGDSSQLDNEIKKSEGIISRLGKTSTIVTGVISSAFAAMGVKAVKAFSEADEAQRKTIALLKATGSAAGVTGEQIFALAGKLQDVTNYSDEALVNLQTTLLKFRNIKSDVFEPTTIAVTDLAAALGIGLNGAANLVGRALENPIQGLTALRRAGVSFTEDQKEQIKGFLAVNDVASAQKLILEELSARFGGAAQEVARGTAILGQIGNQIGELWEQAGASIFRVIEPLLISIKEYIIRVKESGIVQNSVYNIIRVGEIVFTALYRAVNLALTPIKSFIGLFVSLDKEGKQTANTIDILTGRVKQFIGYLLGNIASAAQKFYELKAAILEARKAMLDLIGVDTSALAAGIKQATDRATEFQQYSKDLKAGGDQAFQSTIDEGMTNRYGKDIGAGDLFGAETARTVIDDGKSDKKSGGGDSKKNALEDGLGYEIPSGATDETQLALLIQSNPALLKTPEQREAYLAYLNDQKQEELDVVQQYQQKLLQNEQDFRNQMNSTIGGALVQALNLEKSSNEKKKALADQVNNDLLTLATAFGAKNKNIMKAFNISQAIMNTAAAFTKTLAAYPYPVNIAFAGLTAAAGIAQVATIAGAAQGGIVGGIDTGVDNKLMRVRSGEMIVPPEYVQPLMPVLAELAQNKENGGSMTSSGTQTIAIELRGDAGQFITATLLRDRTAGVIV